MPVRKTTGATVYAGTVVEEGECVLVAKAEGGANRYDKIVAMIEESEKLKSGTENRALQLAACLEEHFPHSMANAVVRAAKERGISHEEMHSEVEYIVAHGIASRVSGTRVVIGSAHFIFEDEGCTIPAAEQAKFDALDPQ